MKLTSQMNKERNPLHLLVPITAPYVIYFEPCALCNLACSFCFHNGKESDVPKEIMSFEIAKKAIDDIGKFPQKVKMIRICGGGEPLLNPRFAEIIKYMKESACSEKIVLVTNGTRLDEQLEEAIVHYIDHVIISVEGINEDQYKKYAGREIDYPEFLNKISSLYEKTRNSTCTLCIKIHGDAVSNEDDLKQFSNTFGGICDEMTVENLVDLFPEVILEDNHKEKFRFDEYEYIQKKVCPQMFKSLQVDADGTVVPCCVDWKRLRNLGNICDTSLLDIWNGDKLKELRLMHLDMKKSAIDPCRFCTMNDYSEVDYLDNYASDIRKRI